jgi:hypothetical protein
MATSAPRPRPTKAALASRYAGDARGVSGILQLHEDRLTHVQRRKGTMTAQGGFVALFGLAGLPIQIWSDKRRAARIPFDDPTVWNFPWTSLRWIGRQKRRLAVQLADRGVQTFSVNGAQWVPLIRAAVERSGLATEDATSGFLIIDPEQDRSA